MALDRDELNKRRQAREAYRRKRQQTMYIRLAIAIAVLLACAVGIFILIKNSEPASAPVIATEAAPVMQETEETQAPTEKRASWEKEPVKIHIAAAGDASSSLPRRTSRMSWPTPASTSRATTATEMSSNRWPRTTMATWRTTRMARTLRAEITARVQVAIRFDG